DNLAEFWNLDMAQAGNSISTFRQQQVERIAPRFERLCRQVLGDITVSIQYYRGWPEDSSLQQALDGGMNGDKRAGHTRYGPHRADLNLFMDGELVKFRASRGEQKVFNVLLCLAQAETIENELN